MRKDKHIPFYTEFYKSSAFLISLVFIIFISPFLDDSIGGRITGSLLVLGTMVGALSVMFSHKYIFWYGVAIVVLSIVIEALSLSFGGDVYIGIKYLRNSFFYGTFALILFYYLMKVQPLSLAEIGNAISIYLLVGLAFGNFYCYYAMNNPKAFFIPVNDSGNMQFDLIYYSFIALTTTGFGDIQPLMLIPRLLAIFETIFGTFYIAVIIGRLVGFGKNHS
jgi:hypothetical protein